MANIKEPNEGESTYKMAVEESKRDGTEFKKMGYMPTETAKRNFKIGRVPRLPKFKDTRRK